jgi:hypothetical protein
MLAGENPDLIGKSARVRAERDELDILTDDSSLVQEFLLDDKAEHASRPAGGKSLGMVEFLLDDGRD